MLVGAAEEAVGAWLLAEKEAVLASEEELDTVALDDEGRADSESDPSAIRPAFSF